MRFKKSYQGKQVINFRPIFFQRNVNSKFDSHYVIQSWWATSRIRSRNPELHTDVSSNVGFVAQLSAMVPVQFYEFNPPHLSLGTLSISNASLANLPLDDNSVWSLSCLHVLEHIGLGRYGDPIDVNGMSNACAELSRVLRPGGRLLISVPVGRERIEFNSQRVIDPEKMLDYFPTLEHVEFSIVDDKHVFTGDASFDYAQKQNYACGLYVFTKAQSGILHD